MKKIFNQELAEIDDLELISDIKEIVAKDMYFPKFTFFSKMLVTKGFSITLYVVIGCMVGLAAVLSENLNGLIAIPIVVGVVSLFLILLSYSKRSERKADINKDLYKKQDQIYGLWFDKNYDDVYLDKKIDLDKFGELALSHPGFGIPGDARITKIRPGYSIKSDNNLEIQTAVITWKYSRGTGKGSTIYEVTKTCMLISGYNPIFNNLYFSLSRNGKLQKSKSNLENEEFNELWNYECNDDVKLRMILTPSVQEAILEKIDNDTFEMRHVSGHFWITFDISSNDSTFVINPRKQVNFIMKDKIVDDLVNDVMLDIKEYQWWLTYASIFHTLIKKTQNKKQGQ